MKKSDKEFLENARDNLKELDSILKELESPFAFFSGTRDRQKRIEKLIINN